MATHVIDFLILLLMVRQQGANTNTNKSTNPWPAHTNPGDPVYCDEVDGKPKWCACKSSTSSMLIDMTPLDKTAVNKPSYIAAGNNEATKDWYFAWSPCKDFDIFTNETLHPGLGEKACKNAGFAKFTNSSRKICETFGTHEKSWLTSSGTDSHSRLILFQIFRYRQVNDDTTTIWRANIRLMCDDKGTQESSVLRYVKTVQENNLYLLEFKSHCCCEGGCANNDPPSNNKYWIIAGSVSASVIVLLVVIIVIVKKCHHPQPPIQFPIPVAYNPENQEEEQGGQERRPLLE